MRLTAFIVIPADNGDGPAELFFYDAETAREAVLAHGLPGRFAVLKLPIYEASLTESLDVTS